MPSWSPKRERQYEKIRKTQLERGVPEDRAQEIAARTVNKQRRKAGETPNRRTQGTGNPNLALEDRTRDELYNQAAQMDIPGRSSMRKQELVEAIRHRH